MQHIKVGVIRPEELANKMEEPSGSLIVVDCRSGMEYSTWHICGAVNIGGSRNTRREIMSGRVTVLSVLYDQIGRTCNRDDLIVVYDQCSVESSNLQSLAGRVADELALCFTRVCFLRGGFIGFQSKFANLCWTNKHKMPDEDFVTPSQSMTSNSSIHDSVSGRQAMVSSSNTSGCSTVSGSQSLTRSHTMITLAINPSHLDSSLTSCVKPDTRLSSPAAQHPSLFTRHSLSGPALPSSKEGPTTVLSYLLLGTQQDALNQSCILKHTISHVINVSTDGPMCPFISPHNFIRIPVLDNFADKITPYFPKAFKFLDDVKAMGGRALVHCSAGISRSPTLAIGYLMKTMEISVTEAYNIVKSSRTSVSPNFNFMGQLTDYEKLLRTIAEERTQSVSASTVNKSVQNRQKRRPSRLGFLSTLLKHRGSASPSRDNSTNISTPLLPSPSVPFARLGINSPMEESSPTIRLENFPATSLDQLHFQPCQTGQTGQRGMKVKRSATEAGNDSSKMRKRLSAATEGRHIHEANKGESSCVSMAECVVASSRRHSSVTTRDPSPTAASTKCEGVPEKSLCLPGRSVSYERINVGAETSGGNSGGWTGASTMDSCRLQECHQSTSSLSSANSHSSNLLV